MSFSAALIAGGRSKRFGSDKAFAVWEGKPLWRSQLAKLEALSPSELLVSCRKDQHFPAEHTFLRVHDALEERGPLGGVSACLNQAKDPLLVILAVDLPQMPIEFLAGLIGESTPDCGVVTRWEDGFWEPLVAVYPTSGVREIANERLRSDDLSLQGLVKEAAQKGFVRERVLSEEDRRYFVNVNTREDMPGPKS